MDIALLIEDSIILKTNLTEKEIISHGRIEYEANPNSFIPLSEYVYEGS